jgi:hypothetical protein
MILLILSIAPFFAGSYFDIKSSVPAKSHGFSEWNPVSKDKYGFFSLKRNLIFTGAILVIGILISFFTYDVFILFMIIGSGRLGIGLGQLQQLPHRRKDQNKWLDGIAELSGDATELTNYFARFNFHWKYVDGKLWYPYFAWIEVNDVANTDEAIANASQLLQAQIYLFAQSNPRQFPA